MNVFEKWHAENPCHCQGIEWHAKQPCPNFPPVVWCDGVRPNDPDDKVVLLITNGRGHDILCITVDGQMHFAPGYTPSQQAEAFRQAMNMVSRNNIFPLAPPPFIDAVAHGGTAHPDALRASKARLRAVRVEGQRIEYERRPLPPDTTVCPMPEEMAEAVRQIDANNRRTLEAIRSVPPGKSAMEK